MSMTSREMVAENMHICFIALSESRILRTSLIKAHVQHPVGLVEHRGGDLT